MSINKDTKENSEIGKKLTDYVKKSQNCEEKLLFPKKEWDELIHWHPVSNIPVEEIYKDLPEVKRYHDDYAKLWLNNFTHKSGR